MWKSMVSLYNQGVGYLKQKFNAGRSLNMNGPAGFFGSILIIVGVVGLAAAILFGLYMWGWYGFIGGIVCVVEAIKTDPVSALDIAFGAARIVFCVPIGVICGGIAAAVSGFVLIVGQHLAS